MSLEEAKIQTNLILDSLWKGLDHAHLNEIQLGPRPVNTLLTIFKEKIPPQTEINEKKTGVVEGSVRSWRSLHQSLCPMVDQIAEATFHEPEVAKKELRDLKAGLNDRVGGEPLDDLIFYSNLIDICEIAVGEAEQEMERKNAALCEKNKTLCKSVFNDLKRSLVKGGLIDENASVTEPETDILLKQLGTCQKFTSALNECQENKRSTVQKFLLKLFAFQWISFQKKSKVSTKMEMSLRAALDNFPGETLINFGLNPPLEKGKLQFRLAMNLLGNGPSEEQKNEVIGLLMLSVAANCMSAKKALQFPFIKKIENSMTKPISEEDTKIIYEELKGICKKEGLDKTMFMTDYDRAMETRSPEVIKRTKTNNILKMVGGAVVSVLAYVIAIPFAAAALVIAIPVVILAVMLGAFKGS